MWFNNFNVIKNMQKVVKNHEYYFKYSYELTFSLWSRSGAIHTSSGEANDACAPRIAPPT